MNHRLVHRCLILAASLARSVFHTTAGSPATFKKELPACREALIKAG